MALNETALLGQISGTAGTFGTGTFTTNSFTTSDNSKLVVIASLIENNGTTTDPTSSFTISDSQSLAWTNVTGANAVVSATSFPTCTKTWVADVTTGASTTISLSCGGRSIGEYSISVMGYTGHDTVSTTGATATGTQNGGFSGPPTPFTITLTGAPASTSIVFAGAGMDKSVAGASPGTGWTEDHDVENTDWGGLETESRGSSTSTSVDWADLRSGGGALFNVAAVAVEIKAAPVTISNSNAQTIPWHVLLEIISAYQDFNNQTLAIDQGLVFNAISSEEALGTPAIAQVVSPVGVDSSAAFGIQSITLNVAPTAIASSEFFGVPVVSLNVANVGIQTSETLGNPTVANVSTIAPVGIPSSEVLGSPSVSFTLLPTGLNTSESFGNPVVTLNIMPTGIPSNETLGAPTVANVVTISPYGIPSQQSLGNSAVSFTLLPAGIPSSESLGTIQTTLTVSPFGIPSEQTLGIPTVQQVTTVSPIGVQAENRIGYPSVSLTLVQTGISSPEAFGNPSVVPGPVSISPKGIPTEESVGIALISLGQKIFPVGIVSREAIGFPNIYRTADVVAVFGTNNVNTDTVDEPLTNVGIYTTIVK